MGIAGASLLCESVYPAGHSPRGPRKLRFRKGLQGLGTLRGRAGSSGPNQQVVHIPLLEPWERTRSKSGWLSERGRSTPDSGSCVWTNPGPSAAESTANQSGTCISARALLSDTLRQQHGTLGHPGVDISSPPMRLLPAILLGTRVLLDQLPEGCYHCTPPPLTVSSGCSLAFRSPRQSPHARVCRKAPPAPRSSYLL